MQIFKPFKRESKHFESKFEPFKRDSKHSNANCNHSNGIRMQIWTIRKGFEAFECKFEPFEKDLKHLNRSSNNSKGIRSIRMQIQPFRKGFKAFWMQVRTIRNGFKAFECKFELFECKFEPFKCIFEPFKRDSKRLNANCNISKRIRRIRMQNSNRSKRICIIQIQILTNLTGFDAFEFKFEPFERDMKTFECQIRTTRKGYEAFDCKS